VRSGEFSIMSIMRLQKFLSAAGVCSRRKGEVYITSGRVRVNGETVTQLGVKVDTDVDHVEVDGEPATLDKKLIYIALNKPEGYITSCDHSGEKIVLDLIDIPERIYPVGRLDKDSIGLLLLTNDGRIHHKLSHPSFDHEKEYDVTTVKPISEGALQKMSNGMPLMGSKTRPARIKRLSSRKFRIILQEGRNRQIRRMVRKVGNQVVDLKRRRIVNIQLKKLPPGKWRYLTQTEVDQLLSRVLPGNPPGS
jgi:pseudouridine synthase